MDYIKEYFNKDADKLNFIELKNYDNLASNLRSILVGVPLPIMSDALAEGISTGGMKDQVNTEVILDGMICTIAIDKDFKYNNDYVRILKELSENLGDDIFLRGIKYLDKGKENRANLYFRALRFINPNHILGRFNYALALERIAQKQFNEEKTKLGEAFLKESTLEFESILDIDEKYPLAYYKLGYHYKLSGQYLKAKLMWEKYLKLEENDLAKEEIREQVDLIGDNVSLEAGLTYMSYNKYEEALDEFLKILPRQEKWWELRYLIGNAYAAMNRGQEAIDQYMIAMELNDLSEEVYNELGIELFKLGKIKEAIEIFTRGLGKISGSYKLYFNRGLGYYQLGDIPKAYEDIVRASELEKDDKNVLEMKLTLEEKYNI